MEPNPYEAPKTLDLPPARPTHQELLWAHFTIFVVGLLVSIPFFLMAYGINRDEGGPKAILGTIPFVVTVAAALVNLVAGIRRLLVRST